MEYSTGYHQCCFPFWPEREARLFFPFLHEKTVSPDEDLSLSTGLVSALFFVVSGEFDVYHSCGLGNSTSHLLARLGRGSLLGEGHVVGKSSKETTIVCFKAAIVLSIEKNDIERYMLENPEGAVLLLKHLLAVAHLRLSCCSARLAHIL